MAALQLNLRYRSYRALAADLDGYFRHGGALLPMAPAEAPAPGTTVHLQVVAPDGAGAFFTGEAGACAAGVGLLVSFAPGPGASALAAFLDTAQAQAALQNEPEATPPSLDRAPSELPPSTAAPSRDAQALRGAIAEAAGEGGATSGATAEAGSAAADGGRPGQPASTGAGAGPAAALSVGAGSSGGVGGGERLRPGGAGQAAGSAGALDLEGAGQAAGSAGALGPEGAGLSGGVGGAGALGPEAAGLAPTLRPPGPGERYPIFHLRFERLRGFVRWLEGREAGGALALPTDPPETAPGAVAELKLALPGNQRFTFWAQIQALQPGQVWVVPDPGSAELRRLLAYPKTAAGRRRLASEQEAGAPPSVMSTIGEVPDGAGDAMPIRRRLGRMSMDDKISLAMSSSRRDERMALASDGNKAIHRYLLKNRQLSLEEVAFMARLPSLNPDVLEAIAKTPNYVQNQTVVKALVYNPKTPLGTALRLLERLPRGECLALSRRLSMNPRLVKAAKQRLSRGG